MSFLTIFTTLIAQQQLSESCPVDSDACAVPLSQLDKVFGNIVYVITGLAAVVLFIMLIVGGFNYITSGGDPQKNAAARHTLTYAIAGMVLVASALLIIRIIEEVTGVRLTIFSVCGPGGC